MNSGDHVCTRRSILGAAVMLGAAGVAPALTTGARAAAGRSHLGKIDVHHHFLPQEYIKEEQARGGITHGATSAAQLQSWSPQRSLELMDQNGIERAIGSISMPGVWKGDVALARRLSRSWNDAVGKIAQAHPARLGFFAVIAPPDVEGALKEIEHALDALHADGIALVTNYGGKLLGDETFRPVLEELNRRSATVYVHPTVAPCCAGAVPGLIPQIIEFPFDTTRSITSLLLSGALVRYGNIRWIFSHGGGTLPFLAGRLGEVARFNKAVADQHPKGIEGQLRTVHCDTASAYSAPQLAAMLRFFPASNILFGSDFPFVPAQEGIEALESFAMPEETRAAIFRGNALALFGRHRG